MPLLPHTVGEGDDLLAALGVALPQGKVRTVEAGQRPPPKPNRFTEWSNVHTFTDEGYLALVTVRVCECCEAETRLLEGIFHAERSPQGGRRLTALGRGANWPANVEWPLEETLQSVAYCAQCVPDLGFALKRVAEPVRTLTIKES